MLSRKRVCKVLQYAFVTNSHLAPNFRVPQEAVPIPIAPGYTRRSSEENTQNLYKRYQHSCKLTLHNVSLSSASECNVDVLLRYIPMSNP